MSGCSRIWWPHPDAGNVQHVGDCKLATRRSSLCCWLEPLEGPPRRQACPETLLACSIAICQQYVNKVEYTRYWPSTSQNSGRSEAGVSAQCTDGVIAYLDSSSSGSSGELTYALPAHSATSTRRIGTASCVTTARRSRRAQQLRFTSSAHSCCRYKCQPFTGGPVYRRLMK